MMILNRKSAFRIRKSQFPSMPDWAQALSLANPLRYFVEAARMIFLKGSRLADLLPHFAALLAAGCLLGLWAVESYRKR